MRRLILAVAMAGAVQGAQAADLPDFPVLRGGLSEGLSRTVTIWQGYYVGVQYGYSTTRFGTPDVVSDLSGLAFDASGLSNTVAGTIGRFDETSANGFGGFVGYNWQWEDVILGLDANYNFGGQRASAVIVPSVTAQTVNGNAYVTTTTGESSMKITDYGSIRGRAGWAIGSFLPYITGGVAIGRADLSRVVTVASTPASPTPLGPVTGAQAKNGAFIYGYSFGGGVDVALFAGAFLRAEVEMTRFTSSWGMDATVTSARGGLGYKF
jgi:hypothetical protein